MSLFNKIYRNWVVIVARGTFCHTMFSGHIGSFFFDLVPHWTHRLVQNLVSCSGSKNCDYRPVIAFFFCATLENTSTGVEDTHIAHGAQVSYFCKEM